MDTQPHFTLHLSEDHAEFICPLLPKGYSLQPVIKPPEKMVDHPPQQIEESVVGKRARKCPVDPYFEKDFEFFKNKRVYQESQSTRSNYLSQKEINNCKNMMESLKKRLATQDIEVRIRIGCEMENVLNKLKRSSYLSVGQFLTQVKAIWKGFLNSHQKGDPIHQASVMMDQYSKEVAAEIFRKKGDGAVGSERPRSVKRVSVEDTYTAPNRVNKRKHPDNIMAKYVPTGKRLKLDVISKVKDATTTFDSEEPKLTTSHLPRANNEMLPQQTESSFESSGSSG